MSNRLTLTALLAVFCGCSRPVPGILTLAPAGMEISDGCVGNADGTLDMPAGGRAQQIAYVEAGAATVTIGAKSLAAESNAKLQLHFDGDLAGTIPLGTTQEVARAFRVVTNRSGPHTLRLDVVAADRPQPAAPVVRFQRLVLTKP